MAKNESRFPVPVWNGADYARVPEGRYQAIAVGHQGPEWVRKFQRWSMLVEFELLDDGARVCAFYNFGNDRSAPKVLRRGKYFKAWTLANGEMPRKVQPMSPDVFLDGQVYTVEVRDNRRDAAEAEKADAEIYSVVAEIIAVDRPNLTRNQESFNQLIRESEIKQSPNQAINQSGLASTRSRSKKAASFALAGRR